MSHKNDSPNVTKKSSSLLKSWWSICLSYFVSCFNSMEGRKRLSRMFSGNLPAMLLVLKTNKLKLQLSGQTLLTKIKSNTKNNLQPCIITFECVFPF